MPNLNKAKETIQTIESIRDVTQVLGDIASSKIRATRASVEHNIYFFGEMAKVYRMVKMIAKSHHLESFTRNLTKKKKNGKTVVILATSKGRFYGALDADLTKYFVSQTMNVEADRIVLGESGKKLLEVYKYPFKYKALKFKSDTPTFEEMKVLTDVVFEYSKIYVFHTKFITLLNLQPHLTDINATDVEKAPPASSVQFITEPEIFKMMEFFEGQILTLLFQAIFLEVDIAHLAARMIAMNQAENAAMEILTKERKNLIRQRKTIQNMQLLQNYSGLKKEQV